MYGRHPLHGLVSTAMIFGIAFVVYLAIEVVDRLTESKAMKARVNEGSQTFFRERGTVWKVALEATTDLFSRFRVWRP